MTLWVVEILSARASGKYWSWRPCPIGKLFGETWQVAATASTRQLARDLMNEITVRDGLRKGALRVVKYNREGGGK